MEAIVERPGALDVHFTKSNRCQVPLRHVVRSSTEEEFGAVTRAAGRTGDPVGRFRKDILRRWDVQFGADGNVEILQLSIEALARRGRRWITW